MSDKARTWKVTYWMKLKPSSRQQLAYKIVQAISKLDAEKKADLYPPLIVKIEEV